MALFTVIGLVAFTASYLGVALLRRWAQSGRALDLPNARSSHTQPTPRGGGLLIAVVTLAGLILFAVYDSPPPDTAFWAYFAGALLIAAVSWVDDLHSLPFWLRILSHGFGAVLIILTAGYLEQVSLPLLGELNLGWLGLPLTFLLIVGLINAYNFMDGIDGLAGLQAVLGGFTWMAIGIALLFRTTSVIGLLLGASSLGFLMHNWSPARIFMGDVGSTFLGFTFAVLIVLNGQEDPRLVILGLLIVWPFIFDTSFTILRRLRRHENIFEAHRSNLYQRLVISGCSHRFVTLLYVGLSLIGVLLGSAWYFKMPYGEFFLVFILPLLILGLFLFVIMMERGIIGDKS